ncbi:hypothetical protein [Planctomyces sp. SH-PL62]|uniref:hypothetical protein n=1 Tax=Planctomyces sp. SH-PL62 TaxID=1636152 RepID=UPI00078EABF2|nr:hypothetical protein [Planctomyces sp. SH-PL62]AMV37513.1 hypothetical protein VT85_08760 [Planctomyces sp. SH-PL62]
MRFSRIDGLDVVTRITGPIHHFLGIEFGRGLAREARVERVDSEGAHHDVEVAGSTPPDSVRREVARANKRLGSKLGARVIRYCTDDPAIPGVYERLAEALAERVFKDGAAPQDQGAPARRRKRPSSLIPIARILSPRKPTSPPPSSAIGPISADAGRSLPSRDPFRIRQDSLLHRYRWRLLLNSLSHDELRRLEKELERSKRRRRSPAK